jgi:predicted nucleotidyltransferase component of viral defense system
MMIFEQELLDEALEKGYRPEILEKVYRLLDLLETLMSINYLSDKLALKGGTAINLFCSDKLRRLSVDIDLNYIGSPERGIMLNERPEIERIIIDICQRMGYSLRRNPRAHSGGKMVFEYQSFSGNKGRIDVDINYMFRSPLWEAKERTSLSWPKKVKTPVLDIHELAAGKLHALLGREASRDLFDSHELLTSWSLDEKKLRQAFTVYAGMERDSWKTISVDNVKVSVKDVRSKLFPVLQKELIPHTKHQQINEWAEKLLLECRKALGKVLPFNKKEAAFLDNLETTGEINPEFISNDANFCKQVRNHPALLWRIKKKS